ncbi:MAG: glycosyl transferase [Isosphaeraceae bacterium]|jgi:dolichol-phosphate mannosyltransferase|nr:MAG: glycosyl transferase [Isosphaeraceae bacterium]
MRGLDDRLDRTLLSVVVPLYNEEETLPELEERLVALVDRVGFEDCEVVLVSDGSTDRTEPLIRELVERDGRFCGVFLTRNFGHQAAVSVGLEQVRGSVVVVLDGDLQDPPEEVPRLIAALEAGADVAYGVRRGRKEGWWRRVCYGLFYRVLEKVAAIEIPLDAGDFCCMRRVVVEAMRRMPERNRFVRGLRAWVGFRQVGVEYERAARYAGRPKYTVGRLLGLAYDGLFSFTRLPVRLIQFVGFVLSCVALVVAVGYVVWYWVSPERFPAGFASLIVSIWFLAGVQLLCLGVVGEYVIRTYEESRGRPVALVREVVRGSRGVGKGLGAGGVSERVGGG